MTDSAPNIAQEIARNAKKQMVAMNREPPIYKTPLLSKEEAENVIQSRPKIIDGYLLKELIARDDVSEDPDAENASRTLVYLFTCIRDPASSASGNASSESTFMLKFFVDIPGSTASPMDRLWDDDESAFLRTKSYLEQPGRRVPPHMPRLVRSYHARNNAKYPFKTLYTNVRALLLRYIAGTPVTHKMRKNREVRRALAHALEAQVRVNVFPASYWLGDVLWDEKSGECYFWNFPDFRSASDAEFVDFVSKAKAVAAGEAELWQFPPDPSKSPFEDEETE